MSVVLGENELVIRGCILYEVLNKKPIQESYENFCRNVGNDVMSYNDFDFWFYRFYNGNHDLHYDRSADPASPLLSNMPLNIIDEVLNRMEILNLLVLMKVSRNFRKVVQNMKMVFDCIEVDFDEHLAITYNSRHKIKYRPNDTAQYSPFRQEPTCTCGRRIRTSDEDNRKEFFVTDEDYIELGVKDLKLIMENQNVQLKKFQFSNGSNQDTQKKFIDRAEIAFKSAKSSTRTVEAHYNSLAEIAQLLPIFHAGKLEEINFKQGARTDGYEQLVGLEQWKNARKFDGFWSLNVPIEHCLHFECFKDHFVRFKEEDAMKLRYMLDRSTNFGYAEITIDPMNVSLLKRAFDVNNDNKFEFVYQSPDNGSFEVHCALRVLYITKSGYKFKYNNKSASTFYKPPPIPAPPALFLRDYQFFDPRPRMPTDRSRYRPF
ncbi:F-box domain-containing protein [Caenorhabditis elegans]|uniref:F-box domain-containing protein n=1 Tax=Caenorhabditis elegans TaxID=6239 RepID=O17199_CAEEL|nr:F-box domain-containing protein [Caenorhabditis elegans]CCD63672.1 F-box domain-containing protein [Caenorhabditis elegans]|eukprot:NP_494013.1 F-box A protein [Caenorhabditis elegans]